MDVPMAADTSETKLLRFIFFNFNDEIRLPLPHTEMRIILQFNLIYKTLPTK